MVVCSSCGRETDKYAVLNCPSKECKGKITRCASCRSNENGYKCLSCGYTGP
ncbi:MAG: RNA-binding protein [Candidatus Micrarchaeota archaeon]